MFYSNKNLYGLAKRMIDELIEKKAKGNEFQITNIKMKLLFKGVMPDKINDETDDSEELINKIFEIAKQFNIILSNQFQYYEG
jgi:adenine C2-methylase RlmN of 23S rRNA A2503 and tRNA A37